MRKTWLHFKKYVRKRLGVLGLSYCRHCGEHLWFDEEKFSLGYNVHSICPKCDYTRRFNMEDFKSAGRQK